MFKRGLAICGAVLAATAFISWAAEPGQPSDQDRRFVASAASGGMLEVQLGQYAAANAGSDDVKRFGQHMVDDHAKANEELKRIAGQDGIDVPKNLNDDDQKELNRLENISGPTFDREYMKQMVNDHEKTIAAFKDEIASGSDTSVKDFASDTLPVIQRHLEMAQDICKQY
jgi:putative membrane protein